MNDEMASGFTIGEVAETTGVSRRTVHFYVQQGLIDPPVGRGRGSYYTSKHLAQLERVLKLQQEGLPLRQIQALPEGQQKQAAEALPDRQLFLRLSVAPGIDLELAAGQAIPSSEQLKELADAAAKILKGS